MRPRFPFWLSVFLCVVALAASSVLFVDYVRPGPVFCDGEGPCGVMRKTIFAYPFGIPLPVFGIAGVFAVTIALLIEGRRARIAQASFAVIGALAAVGLLVIQGLMKNVCPYCAAVDASIVLLAGLSIARLVRGWDPPETKGAGGIALGTALAAITIPMVIGMLKKPLPLTVPDVVLREIEMTPKGKLTIIDFADFECPYCRETHAELAPLLAEHKDRVRVIRKQVPLRMHPHANDAARAACCAEVLGKGEEVADKLFTVPTTELTPEGCEKIAKESGIDPDRFRACLADPSTDARIRADAEVWRAAKGHGLPTLWFGRNKLEGAQDRETMRATLDSALREL